MKLDSTTTNVKMSVRNEYSVVVGNEKNWWLGANKPFAEVKNLNPYTTTETIKTYQVQLPKPSSYSIGVMVGYGIGANLLPTPFIGVGLQYNLIKF